jgi:hypothetical protein
VEESKFCLFSAVLPRCVSSISPRFHYRRHAFCFLPLAAILECPFLGFVFHLSSCFDCFLGFSSGFSNLCRIKE